MLFHVLGCKANVDRDAMLGPRVDGHASYDDHIERGDANVAFLVQSFQRDRKDYETEVATLTKNPDSGMRLSVAGMKEYDRLARHIEAHGVVPIFVIYPRPDRVTGATALLEGGTVRHLIDLSSPFRYPAFYALANRADRLHPNRQGAALISEELARCVAAHLPATSADVPQKADVPVGQTEHTGGM